MPLSFCAAVTLSPLLLDTNKSFNTTNWTPMSAIKSVVTSDMVSQNSSKAIALKRRITPARSLSGMLGYIVPVVSDVVAHKISVLPIGSQIITQMRSADKLVLPAIKPRAAPALSVASSISISEYGIASWYGSAAGSCANKQAPFGTIVSIRVLSTDSIVTCRVDDRGPYVAGRVIDLSPDVFAKVASLSAGLVPVEISW